VDVELNQLDLTSNASNQQNFHVIGVGASAGGLEALEAFFEPMPVDTGAAFVIVQHLSPDFKSHMEELLGRKTRIPVRGVVDGVRVQPNVIYLLPANMDMVITDGRLWLTKRGKERTLSHPIDQFFCSLANDRGDRAVAVVLSGTGSDGSQGVREVHQASGFVLAQDEASAKFDGMPVSARSTGAVDLVMSPRQMAEALTRFLRRGVSKQALLDEQENAERAHSVAGYLQQYLTGIDSAADPSGVRPAAFDQISAGKDSDWEPTARGGGPGSSDRMKDASHNDRAVRDSHLTGDPERIGSSAAIARPADARSGEIDQRELAAVGQLFQWLRKEFGLDFSQYKAATVHRRLHRRVRLMGLESLPHYAEVVADCPGELNELYRDLLIGVTQFFRDPAAYRSLAKDVVPQLFAKQPSGGTVRVWVAGCASGEEAYSLAMLLDEERRRRSSEDVKIKIFATDAHPSSIRFAARGLYPPESLNGVSDERLTTYFCRQADGYQVSADLRRHVVFANHNVIQDAPFTQIDLVTCRNLLIYLQPAAQSRALSLFHFALRSGGNLFLGPSESPGDLDDEFQSINGRWRIYRKRRDFHLPLGAAIHPTPLQGHRIPFTEESAGGPEHERRLGQQPSAVDHSSDATHSDFSMPRFHTHRDNQPSQAMYDELLDHVLGSGLLVDRGGNLQHVIGNAAEYLHHPPGRPSQKILDLILPPLRPALAAALHHVSTSRAVIRYTVSLSPETSGDQATSDTSASAGSSSKAVASRTEVASSTEDERPRQQTGADLSEEEDTTNQENDTKRILSAPASAPASASAAEAEPPSRRVVLTVTAVGDPVNGNGNRLVQLTPEAASTDAAAAPDLSESSLQSTDLIESPNESPNELSDLQSQRVATLESELKISQETLQSTIQEMETTNEELQAANEELVASNEELQSTNEELHSVNEELYTVNAEHQRRVDELAEANADMDNLLVSTRVGVVFLDNEFRIRRFTPAMSDLLGLRSEDVGQTFLPFARQLQCDELKEEFRQVLVTGEHLERQVEDLHERPFLLRAVPYRKREQADGVVVTLVDIAELAKAEQQLRENAVTMQLQHLAIESAINGVLVTDPRQPDNPITYANNGFLKLTGYSRDEVIGRNCRMLQCRESDPSVIAQMREAVREGKPCRVVIENQRKDGTRFWTDLQITPVRDDSGKLIHFVGVQNDVTATRQARQTLERATHEAEAANQAKSAFMANMSHELRTPMTAVLGFADMLAEQLQDAEHVNKIRTIKRNGQYLLALLNDILDLSKIEAGKLAIEPKTFDVVQFIDEIHALMSVRAIDEGVQLHFGWTEKVPQQVTADQVRVRQILVNLISNGLKFTDEGEVRVTVGCHPENGRQTLDFVVEDTGIGIEPSQLPDLFTPFSQSGTKQRREYGGTGLGLSISKRLAEGMGGQIDVDSEPGRGSRFVFSLPLSFQQWQQSVPPQKLDVAAGDDEEACTERSGGRPHSSKRRKRSLTGDAAPVPQIKARVLLADDRRDIWRIGKYFLEKGGAKVTVVEDGLQAVERLQQAAEQGKPFHLVLMDMQMPVMTGQEAVAEIREMGFDTPIIALTADAMEGERQACLEMGCDDYLPKPIDGQRLMRVVAEHLAGDLTEADRR